MSNSLFNPDELPSTFSLPVSPPRHLDKTNTDPLRPVTFHPRRWTLLFTIPGALFMSLLVVMAMDDNRGLTPIYQVFFGCQALVLYGCIVRTLILRWGVDHEKVWARFGPLPRREVRFDQMTRLSIGPSTYKLHAGSTVISLPYNRFDFSLAFIQITLQLCNRRFTIIDTPPTYHTWVEQASMWRQIFCEHALHRHYAYYQAHPDEAADLLSMIPPPGRTNWILTATR